ncbi:hypothetical protein QAD02_016882 [Eretmocerus hayati]|uniref:Uncharacterized protein n=1 Tax=Eretmocerus hayati TaxID=131215 RepID=A0ACC2PCF2_9HYME|nr:hypothetical protein QAD02_016882 [Eretmocerus hayati]
MPKGSLLHAHHSAMGTRDFILKNITYRDHLYICEENEITGTLQLRFLNESQASGKIEIDPIVGGDDYDYDFGYVKDNKDGGHCQGFGGWRPVQVARERDPQLDFRIAAVLRLRPAPNDHPSHKHGGSGVTVIKLGPNFSTYSVSSSPCFLIGKFHILRVS